MQGTQVLAGYKTYGVAILAVAYAAYGYFFAHTLDLNTAIATVGSALGLSALRSGMTTEIQKLLASFGVNPSINASIPGLEDRAVKNIQAFVETALANAANANMTKIAKVLIVGLAFGLALSLTACGSLGSIFGAPTLPAPKTPSQTVYEAKSIFASALAIADAYALLPTCPVGQPICKSESILASVKSTAHATKDSLDAADGIVNDPQWSADKMQASADAASKAASAFQLVTADLKTK